MAPISEELGVHVVTLYNWREALRLQGEVVPASEKEPEGWSAANKFTVVMETAGLNATELGAYCREREVFPEQVEGWRKAAQDANDTPVLPLKEQKGLERLRAQDQKATWTIKNKPVLMRASQSARLGQEKPHETQAPHSRADHPQAAHR